VTASAGVGAFTPPDSRFSVHGRNSAAGFWVGGRGGGWTGTFRTANGAPLVPGRYTGVKNNLHLPSPQPEPGMDIDTLWGYGDPCSADEREFTVNEITRYPDDGTTKSMEIAFEHRCTSPPGVLVAGTISFRVGDTTPLAPWMSGVPAGTPSSAGRDATRPTWAAATARVAASASAGAPDRYRVHPGARAASARLCSGCSTTRATPLGIEAASRRSGGSSSVPARSNASCREGARQPGASQW
jgi:hypothetical protein